MQRFTRDGSDALEKHLAWVCDQVRINVEGIIPRNVLEGLMLTGPYGRGEGGVLRGYNDAPFDTMEFIALVREQTEIDGEVLRRVLRDMGRRLSPFAGTEVHIRLDSTSRLRRSPISLDSYEMTVCQRWIVGNVSLFRDCEHHIEARKIPLDDACQLMLDRCSTLLVAREHLLKPDLSIREANEVSTAIARTQLAMGDIFLIARHQYHWSCVQRNHRLDGNGMPAWGWAVAGHHAQGLEFQLHPVLTPEPRDSLLKRLRQVSEMASTTWLWLEQMRLNQRFASVRNYAREGGNKCPEHAALQNLILNARTFGQLGVISKWRMRHPRERLLRAMPLLLWCDEAPEDEALVASCFDVIDGNASISSIERYVQLWSRVTGSATTANAA